MQVAKLKDLMLTGIRFTICLWRNVTGQPTTARGMTGRKTGTNKSAKTKIILSKIAAFSFSAIHCRHDPLLLTEIMPNAVPFDVTRDSISYSYCAAIACGGQTWWGS